MADRPPWPGPGRPSHDTITTHVADDKLRDTIEAVLTDHYGGINVEAVTDALMADFGRLARRERTLVITCAVHGELCREVVACFHDSQELTHRVAHAHGASYGANCTGQTLTVELLEP